MDKAFLLENLRDIDRAIQQNHRGEEHVGALVGLSGISLFEFYYSKYLDTNSHAELGMEILSRVLEMIDQGYRYPTFCDGIGGAAWVIDHLESQGFMEVDSDGLLSGLDDYLSSAMISDMKRSNYDFLHGAIGYALYFHGRYQNTRSKKLRERYRGYLLEFVSLLEDLAEQDGEDKLKWISVQRRTKEKRYNLSISHGITGIIAILTKLYPHQDFRERTGTMLRKAVDYVLYYKREEAAFSLFPNDVSQDGEHDSLSRLAWCYGDLGIGLRLLSASNVLEDPALREAAVHTLKHAAKRVDPKQTLVKDASVCHGSYGIAQMFSRAYRETGDPVFKDSVEFWIRDGMDKAFHKDGYAGYKQWRDVNVWTNDVSLLEGISGIGLVIIDYLADFETTWDECLMVS